MNVQSLTTTQRQVLCLVAHGQSSRSAATKRNCSKRTIDFHLAGVYDRLMVSDRYTATIEALNRKCLSLAEIEDTTVSPTKAKLTPCEVDAIATYLQPGSRKTVARMSARGLRTFDFHIANVFGKLGISSRLELLQVVFAWRRNGTLSAAIERSLPDCFKHPVLQ